jgi:hypothetical protein
VTSVIIPLEASYLCPDCDVIGDCPERCPSCANPHGLMNLAGVLNRETEVRTRAKAKVPQP